MSPTSFLIPTPYILFSEPDLTESRALIPFKLRSVMRGRSKTPAAVSQP